MNEARPNPFRCFNRRYLIELLPAVLAIGVALAIRLSAPRSQATRLVIAGFASGGLAWMVVVTVAAIRRLDELQQRIHLIAIAVAFAATGALMAVSMFLRVAHAGWVPSETDLLLCMMLGWSVVVLVLNRRYR